LAAPRRIQLETRHREDQSPSVVIRIDGELKAFYDRIYASHSKKVAARVAIVAVARKLAERMHCVLKEQRKYELRVAA